MDVDIVEFIETNPKANAHFRMMARAIGRHVRNFFMGNVWSWTRSAHVKKTTALWNKVANEVAGGRGSATSGIPGLAKIYLPIYRLEGVQRPEPRIRRRLNRKSRPL